MELRARASAGCLLVQAADGTYDTTFDVQGLSTIRDNAVTVVRSGRGRENDGDVDVRTTVTIISSTLTMRRDSRLLGDEWRFRNQYVPKC